MSHTPAPWILAGQRTRPHLETVTKPVTWICSFGTNGSLYANFEQNAHLLKAAPALLEVAKKALSLVESDYPADWPLGQELRSIIAKAEGR